MDKVIYLNSIRRSSKAKKIKSHFLKKFSGEEKEWVEKLMIILRYGDLLQKEAVCANIRAHFLNCTSKT